MSRLTATNTSETLGTSSRFTFTFSEGEPNARFLCFLGVYARGALFSEFQPAVNPDDEFSWNPTDETFGSKVTTARTFAITVVVQYQYEFRDGSNWVQNVREASVTITRSFSDSMRPTAASSAFNITWDNAGTEVSAVNGYVVGYSKIRGTYNQSGITLATGATVKHWIMNYGSYETRNSPAAPTAAGGVWSEVGNCTVYFQVEDSRGFLSDPITKSCTFVPFLKAGAVTAANANFGSSVAISYGITSGSGAKYVVTSSVPKTAGGNKTESIYTGTAVSTSKTFSAETYAALITDRKSVTCTITVKTYSTYSTTEVLFDSRTKQITLSFAESSYAPVLNSGTFGISAVNSGAASGRSGYIQGYSRIRATFNPSNVTLKTGATVKSLSVKFGSAAAVAMTVVTSGTSTKDSAVITETTTVVCTLTDSRGFVKTASFTATMIPYAIPRLTASAVRSDSSGNAQDDGTYIKVTFTATYAAVATDQNTMTVKVYTKTIAASSYTDKGAVTGGSTSTSGTNKTYTKTELYSGYSAASSFNVRVTATDRFGNTTSRDFVIPTESWAIHFKTGVVNGIRTVVGAAVGMVATTANRFQIPDTWKFYRGNHKVFDDGDVIPKDNGGSGSAEGAVSTAGDTMTGNLIISNTSPGVSAKNSNRIDGVAPSEEVSSSGFRLRDSDNNTIAILTDRWRQNGEQGAYLSGNRNGVGNTLYLLVNSSGNRVVRVSDAAAWRTCFGINGLTAVTNTTLVSSNKSIATNTWTQLGSGVTLGEGTWLIKCACRFAANATGRRGIALYTSVPSTRPTSGNGVVVNAAANDYTILEHTKLLRLSATATYYVYALQQSGGSLNVIDATIEYTKLSD